MKGDIVINSICGQKPSIAVIMSVYAGDDPNNFLAAFESLIKQDELNEFRVHIYLGIDGPVSDKLWKSIKLFTEHIHKLLIFKENRGLSYVLNDLIGSLQDELFIFRMDADDICHPQRFIGQLRYMDINADVDILGTAIWEMHGNKTQRIISYPLHHMEAVAGIHKRSPFAHPTVCFRRRVFDVIKAGYPHTNLCEDVALWFACVKNNIRFGNIPEPLLFFRVNENFWQRRGVLRAKSEFVLWTKGVWGMYGINWRLIFPLMRFLYRLSPSFIQKWGYASRFRSKTYDKL